MATLKGKGIVWAVDGITYTVGIVSATTPAAQQNAEFTRNSQKADIRDGNGALVAQVFYDFRRTLTVTAVPYGATNTVAAARTSLDAWCPPAGTLMTVLDADTTLIDDNYNLISARIRRTNTDAALVELEMESSEDNEVATAAIT